MSQYSEETDILTIEKTIETQKLIIYNDDVNTFDWVIETLVKICKHTPEQAEQCSIFIHTLGRYAVKEGSYKKLKPMKEAITERGISAVIE